MEFPFLSPFQSHLSVILARFLLPQVPTLIPLSAPLLAPSSEWGVWDFQLNLNIYASDFLYFLLVGESGLQNEISPVLCEPLTFTKTTAIYFSLLWRVGKIASVLLAARNLTSCITWHQFLSSLLLSGGYFLSSGWLVAGPWIEISMFVQRLIQFSMNLQLKFRSFRCKN